MFASIVKLCRQEIAAAQPIALRRRMRSFFIDVLWLTRNRSLSPAIVYFPQG